MYILLRIVLHVHTSLDTHSKNLHRNPQRPILIHQPQPADVTDETPEATLVRVAG